MTTAAPLLSTHDVVKRFGAVVAIDRVSLDVYEGDVLGIVGDNGAGKSTFLSLLSGYLQPDAGELRFRDERVRLRSPAQTRRALGIEMVYQDLAMAPDLSVWRNLFLGEEIHRWGILCRSQMRRRARDVLRRMNTKIDPDWLASDLSGGERQLVAVARGLLFDRDIVLLDEPTAAVSAAKSAEVIETIRGLHAHGKTIIIISHRLEDVLAVCTRVAVFRAGRVAHVRPVEGLSVEDLVHLTFGGPAKQTTGADDDL